MAIIIDMMFDGSEGMAEPVNEEVTENATGEINKQGNESKGS